MSWPLGLQGPEDPAPDPEVVEVVVELSNPVRYVVSENLSDGDRAALLPDSPISPRLLPVVISV